MFFNLAWLSCLIGCFACVIYSTGRAIHVLLLLSCLVLITYAFEDLTLLQLFKDYHSLCSRHVPVVLRVRLATSIVLDQVPWQVLTSR